MLHMIKNVWLFPLRERVWMPLFKWRKSEHSGLYFFFMLWHYENNISLMLCKKIAMNLARFQVKLCKQFCQTKIVIQRCEGYYIKTFTDNRNQGDWQFASANPAVSLPTSQQIGIVTHIKQYLMTGGFDIFICGQCIALTGI